MEEAPNWCFRRDDYTFYTPSRKDGILVEEENYRRFKGFRFILKISFDLKLPQMTIATAATFFHRFYMRRGLKEFHQYDIGGTCVFLACKIEETIRKLREVAITCAKAATGNKNIKENEYESWRKVITRDEPIVAATICFDFKVNHPYKPMLVMIRDLKGIKGKQLQELTCSAWAIINDSYNAPVSLFYKHNTIAIASIYIAAKMNNLALNIDSDSTESSPTSPSPRILLRGDIVNVYHIRKPQKTNSKKRKNSEDISNSQDTEIIPEFSESNSRNSSGSNISDIQTPKGAYPKGSRSQEMSTQESNGMIWEPDE
ncbi:6630_t:CDS:2 [Diversispora eburnea]|uniref:6630_t:CDS:1 n=1 Tax=Diversispora eburnea TaxID=1213867 RepID=A0A9N9AHX5_9GLOM|nr:6630_t:CDS:2 [Diversispora eburnea]